MGFLSKITSKIESKVLHRDCSHAYHKQLAPKDESPGPNPSTPRTTSIPGEGIRTKDFAHRPSNTTNNLGRSESARHSDLVYELPVPQEDSQLQISQRQWQQRYYAGVQQQRRGGQLSSTNGSGRRRRRSSQSCGSSELNYGELESWKSGQERTPPPAEQSEIEQMTHRQKSYGASGGIALNGGGVGGGGAEHSHHLCFHGWEEAVGGAEGGGREGARHEGRDDGVVDNEMRGRG